MPKASLSKSISSREPLPATTVTAFSPVRMPSASVLPIRTTPDLRKRINTHDAHYFDLHLSEAAQKLRYGFFGDLDLAIIEVSDIQDDGTAVVGTGVGNVPTIARMAKKIIIELNEKLRHALHGLHDIYLPLDPPTVARYPSSR